jgi:hypothetical protein
MDKVTQKPTSGALGPHPVIAALEKSDETTACIEGYLGSSTDATLRIYPALDTAAFVEVPKSGVLHLQASDGETTGRVRAFVPASLRLMVVRRHSASAVNVMRDVLRKFGDLVVADPLRPGGLYSHPFWACARQCEGVFAGRVAVIIALEAQMFREQREEARVLLRELIETTKREAEGVLYACLAECEARHGAPPFMEGPGAYGGDGPLTQPYSLGRLHQRLVQKHRLYGVA